MLKYLVFTPEFSRKEKYLTSIQWRTALKELLNPTSETSWDHPKYFPKISLNSYHMAVPRNWRWHPCWSLNNNVINKYRYWYPCFVYLRTTTKVDLYWNRGNSDWSFLSIPFNEKLCVFFYILFNIVCGCTILGTILYNWLAR